MNFQSKNFSYVTKDFGAFLDEVHAGGRQYLRSISAEQPSKLPANMTADFPSISNDFRLPDQFSMVTKNMHSSPLRISGPVTIWLHYDVCLSLLSQSHNTTQQNRPIQQLTPLENKVIIIIPIHTNKATGNGKHPLPNPRRKTPNPLPTPRRPTPPPTPGLLQLQHQHIPGSRERLHNLHPGNITPRSHPETRGYPVHPAAMASYGLSLPNPGGGGAGYGCCECLFSESYEGLCGW